MIQPWTICRQLVPNRQSTWKACRNVNGLVTVDWCIYGERERAQQRADELNAQREERKKRTGCNKKAPEAAATAQGAEK